MYYCLHLWQGTSTFTPKIWYKTIFNNIFGCETLNQARPYTWICQLRVMKPKCHLLLNRDESICLHPRYSSCIPPSWISLFVKNPFDSECLACLLACLMNQARWSNPSYDDSKPLKDVGRAPHLNASQQAYLSRILGDDHRNWCLV